MLKRRLVLWILAGYLLYLAFFYWYLFIHYDGSAGEWAGTSIDPAAFLTDRELLLSERYSPIRNFLFFLEIPYEWLFYFFILVFGTARFMETISKKITKNRLLQTALFTFSLSGISYFVFYPLKLTRYLLSKQYGISAQSFSEWMRDGLVDFWLNFLLLFTIATILFWLIRKSERRWWLYSWFLAIPFIIFLIYIQPVAFDPLYNDFYPLKDKQLEDKILAMASDAGIPAEHIYEVNMSAKTNTLNAYVTGIGNNARIVLWDTTLERLNQKEILFIMAHEMAHYVEKHIYFGIAGYILLLLAVLYSADKLLKRLVERYGGLLNIKSIQQFSVFPLILLIVSFLSFAASPVTNAVSRYQEMRSDRFAIEYTKDVDAGVSAFQELTKAGLSQVNPPLLVKWFRYGHPTMKERILFVESYREKFEAIEENE